MLSFHVEVALYHVLRERFRPIVLNGDPERFFSPSIG